MPTKRFSENRLKGTKPEAIQTTLALVQQSTEMVEKALGIDKPKCERKLEERDFVEVLSNLVESEQDNRIKTSTPTNLMESTTNRSWFVEEKQYLLNLRAEAEFIFAANQVRFAVAKADFKRVMNERLTTKEKSADAK